MAIYTSQTITGYNSSPPPDDGSQVSANKITWSGQKTKLSDPIKTLAEAINTELVSAFGKTYSAHVTTKSTAFSVAVGDRGTMFLCGTASYAVNLPAAATAGDGFIVGFINTGGGSTTVTITASGAETINGSTTFVLTSANAGIWIGCDGSAWYIIGHLYPVATEDNVLAGSQTGRTVTPDNLAALWEKATAATATTILSIPNGGYCTVNDTATVTSLSTTGNKSGRTFRFRFGSAGTVLTHNATSLILPGGQNITVQAGDMVEFISEGSDNWRMCGFFSDSGHPWARVYSSGEQTCTISTLLQLSHGFGMQPKHVVVRLRCTGATGDVGFVQNDEVDYPGNIGGSSGSTIITTATGVKIAQGNPIAALVRPDTFAAANLTAAQWRWVVVAYA
jgi:hypothetical protein